MRSRCVWYKNGNRTVQYTSTGYAGWCGQRSVSRARSGLPYARPVQTKFKGSNGTSPKRHSTMKNDAANILMSLPETAPAAASFPDYTPAPVPDGLSDLTSSDFTSFSLECMQPDGQTSTNMDDLNFTEDDVQTQISVDS